MTTALLVAAAGVSGWVGHAGWHHRIHRRAARAANRHGVLRGWRL